MEAQHTYDHILKQKLNQLEAPDMDSMWGDMHAILDEKMPKEKKRRYFFWFFNRYTILSLALAACSITVIWYALETKSNTPEIITAVKENTTAVKENTTEPVNNNPGTKIVSKETGEHSTIKTQEFKPTTVESQKVNVESQKVNIVTQKANVATQRQVKKVAGEQNDLPVIASVQSSGKFRVVTATATASSSNETLIKTPIEDQQNSDQEISIKKLNASATSIPADITQFPGTDPAQRNFVNVDPKSLKIQANQRKNRRYFVAGLAVNYHMPVSGQEMSTISASGNENRLVDYLPSVYTQYHLNDKWYLQAEFQYTSPQYIQPIKMASTFTPVNANKKIEESVALNKLYYLNLPVSIHYKPTKNLSVGTGIQYSYLRNSIIETSESTWERSGNSWNKTSENKKVQVKSNPGQEKKKNNGNGNNPGNPATPLTSVDTLAQSLRANDWRILLDVNYKWKNFTGGARFNTSLNNYIDIKSGGTTTSLKDKNQAIQLYIRYDLFNSDRKQKKH